MAAIGDDLVQLTSAELGVIASEAMSVLARRSDPDAFAQLLTLSSHIGQCLGEGARRMASAGSWTEVAELAAETARLADSARAGNLAPEELRGGTFTLTSAGKLGGLLVTPLVNHPEVAILGLHRIAPRPVVRDGEIAVRSMGNVSVTFDHRVVDGARAAAFTLAVIERLQRSA